MISEAERLEAIRVSTDRAFVRQQIPVPPPKMIDPRKPITNFQQRLLAASNALMEMTNVR